MNTSNQSAQTTQSSYPSTPVKSQLTIKRQNFRARIRREHIDNLLSSKRKQFIQSYRNEQQKLQLSNTIQQLLNSFVNSPTYNQSQRIINEITTLLSNQKGNPNEVIKKFAPELVKCFIMFPRFKDAIHLLYKILYNCYEDTFGVDDQKFAILYGDQVYGVKLDRKQLTEYQEAILVLMETIDSEIDALGQRQVMNYNENQQQQQVSIQQMQKHNRRIQKRVAMYLVCLRQLFTKMNCFILRDEFVHKYLTNWTYKLLIEYQFEQTCIFYCLAFAGRVTVPFRSLIAGCQNVQTQKKENEILSQVFQLCVPTDSNDINKDKIPLLSMIIIRETFSHLQISATKITHYFQSVLYLLRVVFNYKSYFKMSCVTVMFELIGELISKINDEMLSVSTPQLIKDKLRQVNVIAMLNEMEFIDTFSLIMKMENDSFCLPLYEIIYYLIQYCVIFGVDMGQLLNKKDIFLSIFHRIDSLNYQVADFCLKSIEVICEYAYRQNMREYFVRLVNWGIDQKLDHLSYHMSEWVAQRAKILVQNYFGQQKIYQYTELENELQRYANENLQLEWE